MAQSDMSTEFLKEIKVTANGVMVEGGVQGSSVASVVGDTISWKWIQPMKLPPNTRPPEWRWTLTIDKEGRTGQVRGESTNMLGKPMSEITGKVRKID